MKIISTVSELKEYLQGQKRKISFVPTMGALHDGHISLIKRAKNESKLLVVSIFVNPTQFLLGEDLQKYPQQTQADTKICHLAGVDVLFLPQVKEMYQEDEVSLLAPNVRAYTLEGATRPGHFSGVLTVVNKLFNIVKPEVAYFGKKDAQQLHLIKLMVEQLFMDIRVIGVDTVRESDGLALSSRNVYLSTQEREEALKISRSLHEASKLLQQNIFNVKIIKQKMRETLFPLEIGYIEIVNRDFYAIKELEITNSIVLVEVLVGQTRLLDNIWL